jgi:arylsulfatase A-like enzyme
MKNSIWIIYILTALVAGSCSSKKQNPQAKNDLPPPNILWITCEDISPALGCYGDTYANTPTLDRLAGEGMLYTRAYATAPICSPARSTLISGIYATSLGTQHLRSDITMPEDFRILPEYMREAGYFCTNSSKTDYNFNPEGRWDENGNNAHWRNRNDGKPFFSVFNFGITHEGPANSLNPDDVKTLVTKHDPQEAMLPPYYPDTPEFRRIWAHQYDLISVLDQEVEKLLKQLKEDDLYENTIIFFFSDHGFGLPRYKRWLYHTGLHVPLIVMIPEQYQHLASTGPGSREDRLVSFVDFAPTVLSLAGIPIPENMPGKVFLGEQDATENEYVFGARSRADDLYEVSRCVLNEQFIYIRNFMPHQAYVEPAIIFGDRKASFRELTRLRNEGTLNPEAEKFWEPKPYEELYNLGSDPFELTNLAEDPQYQGTVKEMRDVLYKWILEHRDVGLLHEAEMMIRSKGSSPYQMGSSPENYQIDDILEAANLCGHPGTTLDEILPFLDHSDPGVRYWAVLSIQAMGEKGRPAIGVLRQSMKDESPSVAIASAELLCQHGLYDEALPVLGRYLGDEENPTVVLQAAISIRKLGEKALPLIPVIEEVYPGYRGEVWDRYRDWVYPMFIGFALDQTYLNCGLELP